MQQLAFARARYADYRTRGFATHRFMTGRAMEFFGRLIRVRRFCQNQSEDQNQNQNPDQDTVAYIVAIADPAQAMELIRTKVAEPQSTIEDLGRVSDALLRSLNLLLGEFVRADEPHRLR